MLRLQKVLSNPPAYKICFFLVCPSSSTNSFCLFVCLFFLFFPQVLLQNCTRGSNNACRVRYLAPVVFQLVSSPNLLPQVFPGHSVFLLHLELERFQDSNGNTLSLERFLGLSLAVSLDKSFFLSFFHIFLTKYCEESLSSLVKQNDIAKSLRYDLLLDEICFYSHFNSESELCKSKNTLHIWFGNKILLANERHYYF